MGDVTNEWSSTIKVENLKGTRRDKKDRRTVNLIRIEGGRKGITDLTGTLLGEVMGVRRRSGRGEFRSSHLRFH